MGGNDKNKGRKAGKKVRVAFRRNRGKPAREKSWTRQHREKEDVAADAPLSENVVAKGDLSRKRTIIEKDEDADHGERVSGIVVAMRGLYAEVDDGQRVWPCTIRRILRTRRIDERHPVTAGDHVRFTIEADREGVLKEGVIESVEPRRGSLTRVTGKRLHTIAANVDLAIVVSSAGVPPLKPHLIDRYIVAAHSGGIRPVICLNKIDVDESRRLLAVLDVYKNLGYQTLVTSAQTGEGIDQLRRILTDNCSAIAGQSGVGKSSLLNAVDPSLNLRVGEVSEDTFKGRHVTTTATLIKLACGGYVVDTPGIKSFDLSAVPVNEVEMHFVEFAEHIPHCRFPNCTHTHEVDCAVKGAMEAGRINRERYESYCRMFEERFMSSR
jgi:ribosome biogenesis GTPase